MLFLLRPFYLPSVHEKGSDYMGFIEYRLFVFLRVQFDFKLTFWVVLDISQIPGPYFCPRKER